MSDSVERVAAIIRDYNPKPMGEAVSMNMARAILDALSPMQPSEAPSPAMIERVQAVLAQADRDAGRAGIDVMDPHAMRRYRDAPKGRNGHDMAPVNLNSLRRLVALIDWLGARLAFGSPPASEAPSPDGDAEKLAARLDEPCCYDAGLLGDGGGGNVDWWQDYLRCELARAHEFYTDQFRAQAAELVRATAELDAGSKPKLIDQNGVEVGWERREKPGREHVWRDKNDIIWTRPTAWAYFAVCRARNVASSRALQAEATLARVQGERDALRDALRPFARIEVNVVYEIVPNGYADPRKWREHVYAARSALTKGEAK